ncbi:MAG TPA: hypothetical protein VF400_17370, partial [Anaeromyxobacteraceae bacterium]
LLASGDAQRVRALGEAEADKAARVGVGQALAIEEQVRAYGGPQAQLTREVMSRFAEAIQASGVDVVPKIVVGSGAGGPGGGAGSNGSLLESLLAVLLSDKLGVGPSSAPATSDPAQAAWRDRIRREVSAAPKG